MTKEEDPPKKVPDKSKKEDEEKKRERIMDSSRYSRTTGKVKIRSVKKKKATTKKHPQKISKVIQKKERKKCHLLSCTE